MADDDRDRTGWFLVEMYALGAILHGFDVVTASGFQAAVGWWIAGTIVALAGWRWDRTKAVLGLDEAKVRRVTSDFRWWVASAIALFVLPAMSRYIESAYMIYTRIGDPPSQILQLTDAKRWRFISSFKDLRSPTTGETIITCSAVASIKSNGTQSDNSAYRLYLELEPILSMPPWRLSGGASSVSTYPNGLAIFPSNKGAPLLCASRLAEWINDQTPVKAIILEQSDPINKCNDPCIDIHIGSAH